MTYQVDPPQSKACVDCDGLHGKGVLGGLQVIESNKVVKVQFPDSFQECIRILILILIHPDSCFFVLEKNYSWCATVSGMMKLGWSFFCSLKALAARMKWTNNG